MGVKLNDRPSGGSTTARQERNRRRELARTTVRGRAKSILESLTEAKMREITAKGMNPSRYFETEDPTLEHRDNHGLDAFQRVLRAAGIRTQSNLEADLPASTLREVAEHPQAKHLVGEIVSRAWRRAVRGGDTSNRAPIISNEAALYSLFNPVAAPLTPRFPLFTAAIPLSELVGQTTGISAAMYKPFYIDDLQSVNSRVAEAAEVPSVKISTSQNSINLLKYGRRIDVTYEVLRRVPIDLLAYFVQRVAVVVESEKVDKVVDVLVNGDGNGNAAVNYNLTTLDPATTANNMTLNAWLAFRMKFLNPYALTTALANDSIILKLMLLNAGTANIPLSALGGILGAQGVTPINQSLSDGTRVGWLASAPTGKIIGFDKRVAIERVFEVGSQIQEVGKWIQNEINFLKLTEVEGYAKIEKNAVKTLNTAA